MSSLDMQHVVRERARFHADETDSQRETSANNNLIEISNPSSTKDDHYAFQFRFSKHIPRVEVVAKQHAKLRSDRGLLIAMGLTAGVATLAASVNPIWGIGFAITGFLFSILLADAIKVANHQERGIVLRLGEFQSIRGPGLFFVVPVVGGMTLDESLSERERIGKKVQENVEAESKQWGSDSTEIRLRDIDMPEDLKKIMSRQASAEREKRATITKAEGDQLAADNLAAAAMTMVASPGAMQLRTLQTIDGLGLTAPNTVILAVPIDILQLVQKHSKAT